jgi:hypothetical protein
MFTLVPRQANAEAVSEESCVRQLFVINWRSQGHVRERIVVREYAARPSAAAGMPAAGA